MFYASLLWATRFELAIALSAPNRNYPHIMTLKRDEEQYVNALVRLELGL